MKYLLDALTGDNVGVLPGEDLLMMILSLFLGIPQTFDRSLRPLVSQVDTLHRCCYLHLSLVRHYIHFGNKTNAILVY